ncbi:MAG: ABC transporter permease [Bdellovibrionota bacterium]
MLSPQFKALYKKEFQSFFKTPLGYVFLVIFLFGLGYMAFEPGRGSFFLLREASLRSFFDYVPWMFIFLVPAVSMKLWADERKRGTVELLFSMPITVKIAVLAKFFAAWTFVGLAMSLTFPMIITVLILGRPDLKVIFLGYTSSMLLAGAMLSVGGFFSAMTKNQVVSFILTVATCFVLLMADSPPVLELVGTFAPRYVLNIFESLSMLGHFESMGKGVIRLSDLGYFAIMISFWSFSSVILLNENKSE